MAVTSVPASATSVPVLAANAARVGATVYNDSGATLYLLCASGTASTTAYSILMAGGALYTVPFGYTGDMNGVWTSADGGFARVTET